MNQKLRFLIFTSVFVLSLTLVFCAGYYRKSITMESGKFKLDLSLEEGVSKSKAVIYDIQNEGIQKKLIQLDKISISTGHESRVTNKGEQPIWLSAKLTGINGTGRISSTNPIFDEKSERCSKPLMPGETLDVNVNLDFHNEAMNEYVVSKGKIEFFDYKSNKKLGEVPLKIINSKPKSSCCAAGENCD